MPARKTAASKSRTAKSTTAKASAVAPKSASSRGRTASPKGAAQPSAGEQEVTIDRRRKADRRAATSEAATARDLPPQLEKREKVQRRRQIDPTTCERDYSDAEIEFMNAMDEYKRTSGRMFPTCSEVLEVIRELGYVQLTPVELATLRPQPTAETVAAEQEQEEFEAAEAEVADSVF